MSKKSLTQALNKPHRPVGSPAQVAGRHQAVGGPVVTSPKATGAHPLHSKKKSKRK